MKLLSASTLFIASTTLVGALTMRDSGGVKVPDTCVEGSSALLNSTDINGKTLTFHSCTTMAGTALDRRDEGLTSLEKRNWNLCGSPCTTYCDSGIGGPDPNDCSTIVSSVKNDSTFIVPSQRTQYWTYGSCQVYMINNLNPAADIVYCYDDHSFGGVVDYIAWNCQRTTNDNGGSCHFYDNTEYPWIQVQTA